MFGFLIGGPILDGVEKYREHQNRIIRRIDDEEVGGFEIALQERKISAYDLDFNGNIDEVLIDQGFVQYHLIASESQKDKWVTTKPHQNRVRRSLTDFEIQFLNIMYGLSK